MSEDNDKDEDNELIKEIEFTEMVCIVCGTTFYIQDELDEFRRDDGKPLYCPNGHGNIYLDSKDKQLEDAKKELAETKVENRQLKCALLKQPPIKSLLKRFLW